MITLDAAQIAFQRLSPQFHGCGWILAMYGSVLSDGQGRDIDLIAVPWRDRGRMLAPSSTLASAGLKPSPLPYLGILDTEAHRIEHGDLIFDIQFRLAGTGYERDPMRGSE